MFEGLDQVNWRLYRSAYGWDYSIPEMLQWLFEISDEKQLLGAFHELFNAINHQGDIYDVTAAVVPFLIQLLDNPKYIRRNWIVSSLNELVRSCNVNIQGRTYLIALENEFATLKSIERGIPVYLRLLHDSDDNIRVLTAQLLISLHRQTPIVRLHLWCAAQIENNPFIRAWMVYAVGTLIPFRHRPAAKCVREAYRSRFLDLVVSQEELIVRVGAACAWIESDHWLKYPSKNILLPVSIISTLVAGLTEYPKMEAFHTDQETRHELLDHEILIEHLNQLDVDTLSGALQIDGLAPEVAHLIARDLIGLRFGRVGTYKPEYERSYRRWESYLSHKRNSNITDKMYSYKNNLGDGPSRYNAEEKLDSQQKQIIESIVNCDPFWQLPTNLFSFFYGLPDSREELQKLLAP